MDFILIDEYMIKLYWQLLLNKLSLSHLFPAKFTFKANQAESFAKKQKVKANYYSFIAIQ
ncbi:hypothetical protein AAKU52_001867 [Pedobacter sp. CG_S7]